MILKIVVKSCSQRSTFGPLLRNIFQNDLPRQVKEASISMYADVYVACDSSERVVKNLVKDGERLTQWYKDNLLQVNCDKYQCMLLGCENTERTINFAIDGKHIEQTQSIKILSVHIDEKLTFGLQISAICKRVSYQP